MAVLATITQIASSIVTATVSPSKSYTLYTSALPSSGFAAVTPSLVFTTPAGATTYSFTYTPTSGTYIALVETGTGTPNSGTLYTDQAHGISLASRLMTITTVSSGTTVSVLCSSSTTFYNLTGSGLTTLSMVGNPDLVGAYFVLRNNVLNTYLSLTPTSASGATITGITSPLVIPPGTSANLVWNGAGYTMF